MKESNIELTQGTLLPEWKIQSINNGEIPSLESLRGKPTLILFFNLGCPGCKGRAIPFANRMAYECGEKLQIVGIHSNFEGVDSSDEKINQHIEELHIRFPIFRDADYNYSFYTFQAGGTPHWVIADKDGKLEYSIFGSDPNNALLRLDLKISEMLNL